MVQQCVTSIIHLLEKLSRQMQLWCPWLYRIKRSHSCVQDWPSDWVSGFVPASLEASASAAYSVFQTIFRLTDSISVVDSLFRSSLLLCHLYKQRHPPSLPPSLPRPPAQPRWSCKSTWSLCLMFSYVVMRHNCIIYFGHPGILRPYCENRSTLSCNDSDIRADRILYLGGPQSEVEPRHIIIRQQVSCL